MYSVLSFILFKPFYCLTETVTKFTNRVPCPKHVILFLSTVTHAFLNIMTTFGWDCPKRPINRGLKMSAATEVGLNVPLKVTGTWTGDNAAATSCTGEAGLYHCCHYGHYRRHRPDPARPGDELFTRLKGTGARSPPLNKIWCLISGPTPF